MSQEHKVHELTQKLVETQEELSDVETKLEMAKMNDDVRVTQEDLVAACQSDKIAASRAMTQNQSLKRQLEELEIAVIQTVMALNLFHLVIVTFSIIKIQNETFAGKKVFSLHTEKKIFFSLPRKTTTKFILLLADFPVTSKVGLKIRNFFYTLSLYIFFQS